MSDTQPSLEYLSACSQYAAESFCVSRSTKLHVTRQQIRLGLHKWTHEQADERVAKRLLTECLLNRGQADHDLYWAALLSLGSARRDL